MMHKIESYLFATTPRILATAIVFALLTIGVVAVVAHLIVDPVVAQQKQWCREHSFAVAGLDSGTGRYRLSQVVCIDDQRRLVLPE